MGNKELLHAAEAWDKEGLLNEGAIDTLRERFARSGVSWGQQLLAGLAGVLIAAALLTLLLFQDADMGVASGILAVAAALAAVGGVLVMRSPLAGYVDACWLAAIAWAGSSFAVGTQAFGDTTLQWIAWIAIVGIQAIQWIGRRSGVTAVAATLATLALLPWSLEMGNLLDSQWTTIWTILAFLLLCAWVVAGRLFNAEWRHVVNAIATAALTVPFLVMLFEQTGRMPFDGFPEVMLGALMLPLVVVGSFLREKGIMAGGALVVAVDAIVFAFDVGGAALGVIVLLVTAAGLLWQAGALKRYLSD